MGRQVALWFGTTRKGAPTDLAWAYFADHAITTKFFGIKTLGNAIAKRDFGLRKRYA